MASSSISRRPDGRWRARYRGCTECPDRPRGHEHSRHFKLRRDGDDWLAQQMAKVLSGTHISPRQAKTTVAEWCDTWLEGYRGNRASTVRQAEVHVSRIKTAFGSMPLGSVKPTHVRTWCAQLMAEGLAESYIYALHSRLAQIYTDAIHDGLVNKSPCSRRTAPKAGEQRAYVITTDQMWGLHDATPEHLRAAVLLGGLSGLRLAEVCGLRVADIDFMRGVVSPAVQYPDKPLKTKTSKTPIPVGNDLALELSAHVARRRQGKHVMSDMWGNQLAPWTLERAVRAARTKVPGLPPNFRFQDLRHYYASLLISDGADVKVVQERLRHASAKTTLDVYTHLFDMRSADDRTRAVVDGVLRARRDEAQAR